MKKLFLTLILALPLFIFNSYHKDKSNSSTLNNDINRNLIHTITSYNNKFISLQKTWPWVVGAFIACCLEVSYSFETCHSFGTGLDCDCLSILIR